MNYYQHIIFIIINFLIMLLFCHIYQHLKFIDKYYYNIIKIIKVMKYFKIQNHNLKIINLQ